MHSLQQSLLSIPENEKKVSYHTLTIIFTVAAAIAFVQTMAKATIPEKMKKVSVQKNIPADTFSRLRNILLNISK